MKDVPGLVRHWAYVPSRAPLAIQSKRMGIRLLRRRPFPATRVLAPVDRAPLWAIYFVWLPDGRLTDHHRFTLAQLSTFGFWCMVVCATPRPEDVPGELADADALVWKALPGYDFSAYATGLEAIAASSPGADVLLLNDAVYGPFADPSPVLRSAPWALTGFTASVDEYENHLQSYALFLRVVTPARVAALAPGLTTRFAYGGFSDVVLEQETRLTRMAARSMSVGALYFNPPGSGLADPMVHVPLELVRAGFPFLKRSLAGRLQALCPPDALAAVLREIRCPVPVDKA